MGKGFLKIIEKENFMVSFLSASKPNESWPASTKELFLEFGTVLYGDSAS